jgi:ubiquitin carboxyl-terminal hydrolase 9/24
MRFVHNLNQFQPEYFLFMKRLLSCNIAVPAAMPTAPDCLQQFTLIKKLSNPGDLEDAMSTTTVLGCKFLTKVGFRTKKSIRGHANDWQEIISLALKSSRRARAWFVYNLLFAPQLKRKPIFSEFLLECPTSEVRVAFSKILAAVAHACLVIDGPNAVSARGSEAGEDLYTGEFTNTLILKACLNLLDKEVPEHGRHLAQYFGFFHTYAHYGAKDKLQLLKLDTVHSFMLVAINEAAGPPIKYQYAELGKLYSVVSVLIRCCDVSGRCQSSRHLEGVRPMKNPFGEMGEREPLMPIQPNVAELLFMKQQYVKKLIEDAQNLEDTVRLIRFVAWENAGFSSIVLGELLWQIAYSYTCEMRPFLDILLALLMMEDSWQSHRIHNALKGVSEDREGLFDTIHRAQSHFQKRAYHCIKFLVQFFNTCPVALEMLHSVGEFKRKWSAAVSWLHDELERVSGFFIVFRFSGKWLRFLVKLEMRTL